METYGNGRILRFDDHVYVVDGKPFFVEEILDMEDRASVRSLLQAAGDLFVNRFYPMRYGKESVGHIFGKPGNMVMTVKPSPMFSKHGPAMKEAANYVSF